MFSHIFVGADDVAASKKFYDAVLGAIGIPEGKADPSDLGPDHGRLRVPAGVRDPVGAQAGQVRLAVAADEARGAAAMRHVDALRYGRSCRRSLGAGGRGHERRVRGCDELTA